jgi:hypothetical protein
MMKRLNHVFDTLCDPITLSHAFGRVKQGKARDCDVRAFAANLTANINQLAHELREGTFRFGGYRYFSVHEPKERRIAAAPVRERIVHHAIIAVCGTRLENSLTPHTYACRKDMGQWKAVSRAFSLAGRHEWALKVDIKSYFDSIDHEILLDMLARKIKDKRLLALMHNLVASYATAPGRGLPIGNLTSQYFANLYLDPLDRLPGPPRVRYMDDTIFFRRARRIARIQPKASRFFGNAARGASEPQVRRTFPHSARRELFGMPRVLLPRGTLEGEQASFPREVAVLRLGFPRWSHGVLGLPASCHRAVRLFAPDAFRCVSGALCLN